MLSICNDGQSKQLLLDDVHRTLHIHLGCKANLENSRYPNAKRCEWNHLGRHEAYRMPFSQVGKVRTT
jgi:hypothetical protein